MRDNLCEAKELEEDIRFINRSIDRRNTDILKIKNSILQKIDNDFIVNLEVIYNMYATNVRKLIDKMRAMYSRGDELKDFQEVWNNAVDALENLRKNTIGYLNLLWLVGIGILLEVPKEDMRKVEKCIKRQSTKDFVLQFLLNSYLDCEDEIELCFEKENPYKKVVEIINLSFEDKKKASDRLTKYMNSEWFKGHYDYEWKNAHKEPGYLGFWSFETAAIVKIFGLDDSKLKENNHYPYEFAHYKNEIKFNITKLNIKEEKEEEEQKQYIKSNHELEKIIPNKFREKVNSIIEDYNMLEDKEFW
ncbi:PoNi-like cognate immunity protein, partial [Clostridium butyricum]|uniref:PoNi-like cognate immunity protein n=1 Tax=Clostridium butyricum TaxID=1492 RepID=UPI0018A9A40B